MNQYYNPVKTIQGAGCFNRLPELLQEMELKNRRVLVLAWSETALEHTVFSELHSEIARFSIQTVVFEASNPTVEQLFAVYQQTKDFAPDAVVAIGGGSILDVGKSLCCLYGKEVGSEDELRELIQNKGYGHPNARWIGVPTTAGTGSEVTCWATIWDPSKDAKRSVESQKTTLMRPW